MNLYEDCVNLNPVFRMLQVYRIINKDRKLSDSFVSPLNQY